MFRLPILLFCFACSLKVFAQTSSDTIQVHFNLNQYTITEADHKMLTLLVNRGVITPTSNLTLIGYADYLGSEAKNQQLSENRANAVADFLVSLGIHRDLVKLIKGQGAVKRNEKDKNGFPADRRVDVVIESPESPKPAPPPAPNPKPKIPEGPTPIVTTHIGQTFRLDNIHFYANRHTIKEESLPELERIYQDLKNNPNIHIAIEGHICCVGSGKSSAAVSYLNTVYDADDFDIPADYEGDPNEAPKLRYRRNTLSRNRAKYIYEWLIKKGIDPARMQYKGFGNLRPVVQVERTPEDEALNRRVEIRITER
jgi:outer membrane protein OmpA-like peptidoglycan-associated protein